MYYLDEIMDRTFETWGNLIQADDYSFWGDSVEIEAKPNDWTRSAMATSETTNWDTDTDKESDSNNLDDDTKTETETTQWNEGADTAQVESEASNDSNADSNNWETETTNESNAVSEEWKEASDSETKEWKTDTEKIAAASVINELTDAVSGVIEDINPFTDEPVENKYSD